MHKYLCTNGFKLAFKELDISEELEKLILFNTIIELNRNIDKKVKMYLKIICK